MMETILDCAKVNGCQYFLIRLVEEARKEDSANETMKFSKYVAYGTKISYLLEKIMKSLGKWKKLPSSKVLMKTDYTKVQLEAQKKRKIK